MIVLERAKFIGTFLFQLSEKHTELEDELNSSNLAQNTSQAEYEAEEDGALELPPPMKPIQEPCIMPNGPPTYKDKDNTNNLVSIIESRLIN